MIRNSSHLLVAVLLAVAGCKLSSGEYAPKTDADCAPDEKACGYKCVSRADPATGCGNPGCTPCAKAATGPICSPEFACVSAEKLEPWGEPRGMLSRGDVVYWTEVDWSGDVYRWDPAHLDGRFNYDNAEWVATDLDPSNSGAVFRLAWYPGYMMYAGGLTSPGGDLAIFSFDPDAANGVDGTLAYSKPGSAAAQSWVYGLAFVPAGIFFTADTDEFLYYITGSLPSTTAATVPLPAGALVGGLTARGTSVYFGYPGTLARVDPPATDLPATVLTGLSSWPSRITVFNDGTSDRYVWADERDGTVWTFWSGQEVQLDAGDGTSTPMDVAADATGVVWSNRNAGRVTVWRFATGDVFDLPTGGGSPRGVTLTTGYVYWTESSPNGVYRVAK